MTYLEKPGEPVEIKADDIPIGSDWTYECRLLGGVKYHIYLIGEWTSLTDPDTDYDILVYDEDDELVSTHTHSAGLPEQVSNDGSQHYFMPEATGVYSFRIVNDPLESRNSENATFMIIQHIEPNVVYSKYMEGRNEDDEPVLNTSWAYEFNVSASTFEIQVDVPPTLDMYEVRLYPMANLDEEIGEAINGALVPWEPGLYGELRDGFGGFNTAEDGYRAPDAFASCEHLGQDMTLRYNNTGNTLYHLVFIAEHGNGTVNFQVKTDFEPPEPPPEEPDVRLTYIEKPGVPVEIEADDIPVSSDWTYECRLLGGVKYHIYLIGEWTSLTNSTDYDILVYDEDGALVSTHTQSSGLPEQVSNDGRGGYFLPSVTGNYSFRIVNDPLESQSSKNATFMIIQHIEPNVAYSKLMEGRDSLDNPVFNTKWAYEFNVSAESFEVYVDVPP
ncbi:MAG: hypothetical protein ACE5OO_02145, partial [Candidatus Bathyarchaeia archaeon]